MLIYFQIIFLGETSTHHFREKLSSGFAYTSDAFRGAILFTFTFSAYISLVSVFDVYILMEYEYGVFLSF